jgi:hypothetical protein
MTLHYNRFFALNTNLQFMEIRVTLSVGQQWLKRIIFPIMKKKVLRSNDDD